MGSSSPLVKPASASGQSTSSSTNSPQNRSWWARSWPLALSVALGAAGVTLTWLKPETHSLDYAVCSANRTIYTVDSDLPNVQCIFVHDTLISDTGDLGTRESTWPCLCIQLTRCACDRGHNFTLAGSMVVRDPTGKRHSLTLAIQFSRAISESDKHPT